MYGGGGYSLDLIKEIRVTDAFHDLSQDQKQCQTLVSYEDCMTDQLVDTMNKECHCIPYELSQISSENAKVIVCEFFLQAH